jgi:hypothetical protein
MHEFQTFVYLGMQKTGTTFISNFLRRFSKEKELVQEPHKPVGPETDRSKFFFISVRDPLDAYLSLYSYGSEAKGKMRNRFARDGIEKNFYDGTMEGFRDWLNYVLRIRNAAQLDKSYANMGNSRTCEIIGFQSWRYLRLALPTPSATLALCKTDEDVRALYKAENSRARSSAMRISFPISSRLCAGRLPMRSPMWMRRSSSCRPRRR